MFNCALRLSLALFMARVLTDDPNDPFAPNNRALITNFSYRRANFHDIVTPFLQSFPPIVQKEHVI